MYFDSCAIYPCAARSRGTTAYWYNCDERAIYRAGNINRYALSIHAERQCALGVTISGRDQQLSYFSVIICRMAPVSRL